MFLHPFCLTSSVLSLVLTASSAELVTLLKYGVPTISIRLIDFSYWWVTLGRLIGMWMIYSQGHNGDVEEDPSFVLKHGEGVSKNRTWQGALLKRMADQYEVQVCNHRPCSQ